jgi:hypothetical protein
VPGGPAPGAAPAAPPAAARHAPPPAAPPAAPASAAPPPAAALPAAPHPAAPAAAAPAQAGGPAAVSGESAPGNKESAGGKKDGKPGKKKPGRFWRLIRGTGTVLGRNRELCADAVIAVLVAGGAVFCLWIEPAVAPQKPAPQASGCPAAGHLGGGRAAAPVRAHVQGSRSPLVIVIGGGGRRQQRDAGPLAITTPGSHPLPARTILCTQASDFVRTDGIVLPANQISSQAVVSNSGEDVILRIWVAPRFQQVSGFGTYSGTIGLNDARATGASIPVKIEVQYPYLNRVALCGLLLAYAGLVWGLLVRVADRDLSFNRNEPFFANLALRIAVLATAVPIINAQVLSNPAWTGTLGGYIKLGGVVGAAAIAATPSLRAIVSRLGPARPRR